MGSKPLELLISKDAIQEEITAMGRQIDQEYAHEEITLVMIMKGAICLVADLIRHIHVPCSIDYVQASSYGMQGTQPGELHIFGMERLKISGKNVLIVDDIFDSGNTLFTLFEGLKKMGPKSIKSLVLLTKKVNRKVPYEPDFSLFHIEDHFVVGYGLDYKEHFRGLNAIYILNQVQA